jgi:hypothetical protein
MICGATIVQKCPMSWMSADVYPFSRLVYDLNAFYRAVVRNVKGAHEHFLMVLYLELLPNKYDYPLDTAKLW